MNVPAEKSRARRALAYIGAAVVVLGTLGVTAAAFALSYDAIRSVGIAANVRESWAWMLPVSVDGAMAVATVAVLLLKQLGRSTWYPWVVVGVGFVVSAGCNALHSQLRDDHKALPALAAVGVSVVPPLMLILSVELLAVLTKALGITGGTVQPGVSSPSEPPAAPVAPTVPVTVLEPLLRPSPTVPEPLSEPHLEPLSEPPAPLPATVPGTPAETPEPLAPEPLRPARNPRGSVTPAPPVTSIGTPAGTADGTPGDEELLAILMDPERVPREPDGTVPIKRAMRALKVGRPRAMQLLADAGLLRYPDPDDGSGTDTDPEPEPPVNGHDFELTAAR